MARKAQRDEMRERAMAKVHAAAAQNEWWHLIGKQSQDERKRKEQLASVNAAKEKAKTKAKKKAKSSSWNLSAPLLRRTAALA